MARAKKITTKTTTKKVRIVLPIAGKFLRSENVGDVAEYPAALADEMVENKYAEFVK